MLDPVPVSLGIRLSYIDRTPLKMSVFSSPTDSDFIRESGGATVYTQFFFKGQSIRDSTEIFWENKGHAIYRVLDQSKIRDSRAGGFCIRSFF